MYPRRADRRQSRGKGDSAESREQVCSPGWCVGEYPPHCPLDKAGELSRRKRLYSVSRRLSRREILYGRFCIGRILIWILAALM